MMRNPQPFFLVAIIVNWFGGCFFVIVQALGILNLSGELILDGPQRAL